MTKTFTSESGKYILWRIPYPASFIGDHYPPPFFLLSDRYKLRLLSDLACLQLSVSAHQPDLSPSQDTSALSSSFSQRENIFTFKLEIIPLSALLDLPFLRLSLSM